MLFPIAAIGLSVALILLLCAGDPKRRRSAGERGTAHSPSVRWLFVVLALLPGLFFGSIGDASGLLVWFGGSAVAGWLIALCFTSGRDRPTHRTASWSE